MYVFFSQLTRQLKSHPCIITVTEMGAIRHFLKTNLADKSEEEKQNIIQPVLEVNPSHPLIHKLHKLKSSDDTLARLLAQQVHHNVFLMS